MSRASKARTVLLLALVVFLALQLQRHMLYYPSKTLPSSEQLQAAGVRMWPAGIDGYRGFVSIGPDRARGTVVIFHGNAGNAADRIHYVNSLVPLGYRVVLAEYPGYGLRPGRPGEPAFRQDGDDTMRLVEREFGLPIHVLGESLGCGVAAGVARDTPVRIDSVILITPWDTLLAVAREKFPWLPVRLFLRDSYDSVSNLRNFKGRIAVVGAERDEVIPVSHAHVLFSGISGDKRLWTIPGAGHNDWPLMVDRRWWKEIMDFAAP